MSSENHAPVRTNELSQEQIKKIADKLNEVVPQGSLCNACGKGNFAIAPHMVAPVVHHQGGMVVGGATYPQVMLICTVCGNTRYHNTVVLGLTDEAGNV